MVISVIPIGNSRGIRIPKSILQQLDIQESLELEIHDKELLLRPVRQKPRENWSPAFKEMHNAGEDKIFIDDLDEQVDFDWEW